MKPIDIESPKVKDASATTKTDVATTKKLESSPPSIKRLFQTVKAEQPMLCVGVLLLFAAESSTQVIPLIVAKAYDSIISPTLDSDTKMEDVNYYMTVSVLIFIAGSLAGFVRYSIFAIVAERMVARMRIELYSSILDQEIAFFDENKSGELISRLGSDTTLLQVVMSQSLPEAVVNIVKAIVSICLIFVISPELAGVSVAERDAVRGSPFRSSLIKLRCCAWSSSCSRLHFVITVPSSPGSSMCGVISSWPRSFSRLKLLPAINACMAPASLAGRGRLWLSIRRMLSRVPWVFIVVVLSPRGGEGRGVCATVSVCPFPPSIMVGPACARLSVKTPSSSP
mmetsp:Transcript_31539/g.36404  ORF Transcript_31539/g.36404 Transcript_31539/m.36404 type:complete len:340 (-) Transcript_31539:2652-3671(-)